MSMIILPRRYYSQPQGAIEVDWGHPLARGLQVVYHPAPRGMLLARESSEYLPAETAGASIQTGYDRYQHGIFPGSTYLRLNNIHIALPTLQSATFGFTSTMFALARMGSSTNSTLVSLARTDTDTLLFRYALLSDRTSRLQTRGTGTSPVPTLANVDSPVAWTAGLYRFAVAVSPGVNSTGRVYIDGTLSASGSITDATVSGPTLLSIGALERTSVSQQFDGGIALAGVFSRPLDADEAKALSENPWQLFKARPQRIYFDLGAGATGDISATGTVSVTGTAALSATGSLSTTGALAWTGSAALSATGALAAAGAVLLADTATLSAVGALNATGAIAWTPIADLSAAGSLAAAGAVTWTGTADLQSPTTNDIAATGTVSWTASADLSAIGSLSAAATVTVTAAADLTAAGTLAGTGTIAWTGTATAHQGAAMTATGALSFTGTATLAEVSGLIARGDILISGTALLRATGSLGATAALSWSGSAALTDVAVEVDRYPRFSLDRINRVTLDRNTQITLRR